MSSKSSSHPRSLWALLPAMLAILPMLTLFAPRSAAQETPAPKFELYAGYSVFYPGADIHGERPLALLPLSSHLDTNFRGIGGSATYNFNRWLGLSLDLSRHFNRDESTFAERIDDTGFSNISFGPKFTFRHHRLAPFLEVLVGDHQLSPDAFHNINKLGVMFGGGLDINLSRHIAWRLIRADYVYSNYQYGDRAVTPRTEIRGARAQMGLVFLFAGGEPPAPPSAACSLQPSEVFAGEQVTVTASGSNFNPRRTVKYEWSGTGVRLAGSDSSAQIDTAGLQPGGYGVTANLSDGRKNGSASCSARFTVKEPRPPVISCSADPSSVQIGGVSTITSRAGSPDRRSLTYSYSASSGNIDGSGSSARLNTQGASPGAITITCMVSDDRSPALSASSSTTVNVEAPPPPPAPAPQIKELEAKLALHSIYFQTARPTEENPGGGLLDSQEHILKVLADDFKNYLRYMPDAHLILGGHADPRGTPEYNKRLTERRVERAKAFLVEHGVPADHFETRSFGEENQLTAAQTKDMIEQDTELNPADRQQMLGNLRVLVLANNRRVDVTLSTTGQQSTRLYPFNAKDYLALVSIQGGQKKPAPRPRKKARN